MTTETPEPREPVTDPNRPKDPDVEIGEEEPDPDAGDATRR